MKALVFPWSLPLAVANDHAPFAYRNRPYEDDVHGPLKFPDPPPFELFPQYRPNDPAHDAWKEGTRTWLWLISAAGGPVQSTRDWATHVGARLYTPSRLELDVEIMGLTRSVISASESFGMTTSALHATLRFAHTTNVQFRTGIGARFSADDRVFSGGFDVIYGIDAYLDDPLVLSASASFGMTGHHIVTDLRASLGAVLGPCEVSVGYEQIIIGGEGFPGPRASFRIWL